MNLSSYRAVCVVGILALLLTELSSGKRPPKAGKVGRQANASIQVIWVDDCVRCIHMYGRIILLFFSL